MKTEMHDRGFMGEREKEIPLPEKQPSSIERANKLVESIPQKIREDIYESGKYAQYLKAMSHFTSRSVNNNILIYSQRPDATLVEGFEKWKRLGRSVNPGAKGIQIIEPSPYKKKVEVPLLDDNGNEVIGYDGKVLTYTEERKIMGFKLGYVFDVSDTHGKPIPTIVQKLESEEDYSQLFSAIQQVTPVPITIEMMQGTENGYYSLTTNDIHISKSLSEVMKVKTTLHELSHYYLHNSIDGIDLKADRNTREVEAESCAYAICSYYGIDSSGYSFGYVAGWSQGKELKELKSSLDAIKKTVQRITSDIDGELLHRKLAEQTKLTYRLSDGYLFVEKQDETYQYRLYDRIGREQSTGNMSTSDATIDEAATVILQKEGKNVTYANVCKNEELFGKLHKRTEELISATEELTQSLLPKRSMHH